MPFYEYQCSACHHHLEVMQKVDAPRLKKCPNCGKSTLSRLISAPVFRLAGSGWYETDFKSDKENKRNLAGSGEADAPSPDATDKSASKDKADTKDKAADKSVTVESGGKDKSGDTAKESSRPAAKGAKPVATRRTVSRKAPARAPVRKAATKGKRR